MSSRLVSSDYSPLAVDLLISQVGQAALKAYAGLVPDKEEISAAEKLNGFFHDEIEGMDSSQDFANDVVPNESIREVLRGTLAQLSLSNGVTPHRDRDLLQGITEILGKLIQQRSLENNEAKELVNALLELDQITGVDSQPFDITFDPQV